MIDYKNSSVTYSLCIFIAFIIPEKSFSFDETQRNVNKRDIDNSYLIKDIDLISKKFTLNVYNQNRFGIENGELMVGRDYKIIPSVPSLLRAYSVLDFFGGEDGKVISAIEGTIEQKSGVKNSGWAILGVAKNSGDAPGGMVGVYGKHIRNSKSAAGGWAGTFEMRDLTGQPNSNGIAAEFDVFSDGPDTSNHRQIISLVAGNKTADRTSPVGYVGSAIQMGPFNGDNRIGRFVRGINQLGLYEIGIDFSGTYSRSALRISSPGAKLSFDPDDSRYFKYENGMFGYYTPGNFVGFQIFDRGGLRVPSRPGDPVEAHVGEIYYDTLSKKYRGYTDSGWRSFVME